MSNRESSGRPQHIAKTDESGLVRSTGRDRQEWFDLLDSWDAVSREYREIAAWLTGEYRLSSWWAQKLIVEYQQDRGVRARGSRPDGTYTTTATKTIDAPLETVYLAIVDVGRRTEWLPEVEMTERTARHGRSARFDWDQDSSRVNFTVQASPSGKTQVSIEQERLPTMAAADAINRYWGERLTALRQQLEKSSETRSGEEK